MPFRLVGIVDGIELGLLLRPGDNVLGASKECDLQVDHPTVSRRHARLCVTGSEIEVVDEGSHNGTYVNGRRVERAMLEAGTPLAFGKVKMTLEEISELDVVLGFEIDPEDLGEHADGLGPKHSTVGFRSMAAMPLELMPDLLSRLEREETELEVAQSVAAFLFESLPTAEVGVRSIESESVVFEARREIERSGDFTELVARGESLVLTAQVMGNRLAETLEPLFGALGSAMRIAAGRTPRDECVPSNPDNPRRPDPPSVVPAIRRLYDEAEQVAQGDVGVLIGGESGTGKEVLARFIHQASPRRDRDFVALNCAALPHDLLEAELFGIERGVATGVDQRPGKFEAAHDGTLFLDEIGDMSLETQAKILRVLQEGVVYRLGATHAQPARCRVIAASNRDLGTMRAEGAFREDLYYRIAVWVVEIPPLRRRVDDIANLAAYFLQRAARKRGHRVRGISAGALLALRRYRWPGNIRQLENEMARVALFLNDGDALDSRRLNTEILLPSESHGKGTLEERLENLERMEILAAFKRCGGNATEVAKDLGIGRSTLYRRMSALAINFGNESDTDS